MIPTPDRRGFNLFGWMRPSDPPDDKPVPYHERNEREREPDYDAEPPPPRPRSADDAVRDPSLDEELEIPAFLRRQMNPR
jgi:cell division protein FtsZ